MIKCNIESIYPTAHVLFSRLHVLLAPKFNRTNCNGRGLKILLLRICNYAFAGQKNKAHILISQKYNHYALSLMIHPVQFLSFPIFYHYHSSIFSTSFLSNFSSTVTSNSSLLFLCHLYNRSTFIFLNYLLVYSLLLPG